jgi:hypothetical protein
MDELTPTELLEKLRQRGIEINARDGRLQINAPSGAVDAELRSGLARRKAELLDALAHAQRPFVPEPLTRRSRDAAIPQTQAQQGMWLIDHFAPGNVAYNIPEAFLVESSVDIKALQRAVDMLLQRHEALRISFYEEGGALFQAVAPHVECAVEFTDLSNISDKDTALQRCLREQARRPFDLAQPPLIRFHLFRIDEVRHIIFFNIHHILADRRSLRILRDELGLLYQSALREGPSPLPELPVQFPDYAVWAAKHLSAEALPHQVEYWRRKLDGVPAYLELPGSRAYPEQRTPWGATVPVTVSGPVRDALARLGQQEGATLFMVLLAALAVLLHQSSGAEDFCVGSPFTHRKQVETQAIIGMFVNMLALRCQVKDAVSFRELLRQVRATALDAYENGDLPFQDLVRALKVDPRTQRSPLFQVMFNFDSEPAAVADGMVQLDTAPETARYDLTLELRETPQGLAGVFEFCTDLFYEEEIERLARHLPLLLESIAQQPDAPLSALSPLNGSLSGPLQAQAVSQEQRAPRWINRLLGRT